MDEIDPEVRIVDRRGRAAKPEDFERIKDAILLAVKAVPHASLRAFVIVAFFEGGDNIPEDQQAIQVRIWPHEDTREIMAVLKGIADA